MAPASSVAGELPGAGVFRRLLGLIDVVAGLAGIAAIAIAIWRAARFTHWPFSRLDMNYVWRSVDAASWIGLFGFLLLAGLFLLRGRPAIAGSSRATVCAIAVALHLAAFSPLYLDRYGLSLLGRNDALIAGGAAAVLLAATLVLRGSRIAPPLRAGVNSGAAGILMIGIGLTQALGPSVGSGAYRLFAWELIYGYLAYPGLMTGMGYATTDIVVTAIAALAQACLGAMIVAGSAKAWRWGVAVTLLVLWLDLRVLGTMGREDLLANTFIAANLAILFMLYLGRPTRQRQLVPDYDPQAAPFEPAKPRIGGDADWRTALAATLAETGATPPAVSMLRRAGLYAAIFGLSIGAVLFRSLALPELLTGLDLARQYTILTIWTLLSTFFVFALVAIVGRAMRAVRARDAARELLRSDGRRPVLFLRSFEIDEITARPNLAELLGISTVLATPEQRLTAALTKAGPVLAIGRPGEKLPPLGAARFYVSDELWKQKIADVAAVSQMVVVTSGVTSGLAWEIRHLMASVAPERLTLWAHPHLIFWRKKAREAEWALFNATLGKLFRRSFPAQLGLTELFVFDKAGTPERVQPRLSLWQRLARPFFGILRPSVQATVDRLRSIPDERRSAELP